MNEVRTEFYDWRTVCPTCGRFIANHDVRPMLDVLTIPGYDILRDMADCGRCGEVEVTVRPTRWRDVAVTDAS